MNDAFWCWHAAYSAAAIALGIGTATPMGAIASKPTATQNILVNSKFKLELLTKLTGN